MIGVPGRVSGRTLRPLQLLCIAFAAAIVADLSFRFRPSGYLGGSSDEQRYLEVALQWLAHGPEAGTTHWALRHPLILSVVAAFRLFGISMETFQLVPRLYGDLLIAVTTPMIARHAGLRAAGMWLAIALVMPVIHTNATNVGPEILELFFVAVSIWAFWEARAGGRWSGVAMIISGAAFALATLTRETSACLVLVYGYAWLRGRAPRRGVLWFAAGFVPLMALDNIWLWSLTGHPLYRLHIDEAHTHIYSAHLIGGVYQGRVLFNPDLASRWLPPGPVKLNWMIDPILNFFASPDFGLIFFAWAVLALARPTRAPANDRVGRAMPWLLAIALACYLIVTWALTLRPQPRYYLCALYAATIAVTLLATRPNLSRAARRLQASCVGLVLLCGSIVVLLNPDRQINAKLIVPWLRGHPGAMVYFPGPEEAHRMAFPAILGGVRDQITAAPAPLGALRFRDMTKPSVSGKWQAIETLTGPSRFPYLSARKAVVLERRIG